MSIKRFGAAMVEAISERMHEEPRMGLIGSAYLLGPTGGHPLLDELTAKFPERVIVEPPIAEASVASLAIGAAMGGCPTLAHFGLAAFAMEAWSRFIHEAGAAHALSHGQVKVPAVFTMMHGATPAEHAQHNRSPYASLANCPGIEIVLASTPADIKGLMATALRSNNPTVVMNHPALMAMEGEVPDHHWQIPFGQADVKRTGADITLVATSHKVVEALAAADTLADQGVSAEVIDPRTLVPLDREAIIASMRKTGRLVVVDEGPLTCGFGAEVAALAAESALSALQAPVIRLTTPDAPVPRSTPLQAPLRITAERIVEAAWRCLN